MTPQTTKPVKPAVLPSESCPSRVDTRVRTRDLESMVYRTPLTTSHAIRHLFWLRDLVCEILSEIRIALRRIQFRHTNKLVLQGVDFGPALEETPTGHLVACNRTHSSIRDKLIFESKFHWATTGLDHLLFLQAWDMGAKYSENKERLSGMDTLLDPGDLDLTTVYENYITAVQAAEEVISRQ